MDLELNGKKALITGASKGIGRAAAASLAAEGCELLLVARTEADLDAVRRELADRFGVAVEIAALDLSRSESVDALAEQAGRVDVLVNNAGAIPVGSIERVDEATWRDAWDLKVFGYVNLIRRLYPSMREAGGGVIVNVIGAAGERPNPGYIAGAAGNAALMALTRAMGGTSRRDGIRVVGINPGLIETERLATMLGRQAERRFGDASRWEELKDPVYPPGLPEHIGDLVAFLASPRSANTTGTIVTADGGASAR